MNKYSVGPLVYTVSVCMVFLEYEELSSSSSGGGVVTLDLDLNGR